MKFRPPTRDHPRLCGEKRSTGKQSRCTGGSPPPMRGKVFPQNRINIIVEDHPRLCGEKFVQHLQCYLYTGSPPPMRGKVLLRHILACHLGITPAYAGKRSCRCGIHCRYQDHPRLCGEKETAKAIQRNVLGSPPPMRGKVSGFASCSGRCRITPAYAGKSGDSRCD